MKDNNDLHSILDEIVNLCDGGQIDDAIRFSGEELARYDNKWRYAFNRKVDGAILCDMLRDVIVLGNIHARLLSSVGLARDAYETCLSLLLEVALQDKIPQLSRHILVTLIEAIKAFEQLCSQIASPDNQTIDHIRTVVRYNVSILYAVYNEANHETSPDIIEAYRLLRPYVEAGVIESPEVNTPAGKINALHPIEIMNDWLGRVAALVY